MATIAAQRHFGARSFPFFFGRSFHAGEVSFKIRRQHSIFSLLYPTRSLHRFHLLRFISCLERVSHPWARPYGINRLDRDLQLTSTLVKSRCIEGWRKRYLQCRPIIFRSFSPHVWYWKCKSSTSRQEFNRWEHIIWLLKGARHDVWYSFKLGANSFRFTTRSETQEDGGQKSIDWFYWFLPDFGLLLIPVGQLRPAVAIATINNDRNSSKSENRRHQGGEWWFLTKSKKALIFHDG